MKGGRKVSQSLNYNQQIHLILEDAKSEIEKVNSTKELNELRVKYLGKSGIVTS
ncbi:MAG: hypothetical protein ACK4MM_03740, partial [Fervidobacterium sp.]